MRLALFGLGLTALLVATSGVSYKSDPGCGLVFGRYSVPYALGLAALAAAGLGFLVVGALAGRRRATAQSLLLIAVSCAVGFVGLDVVYWFVSSRDSRTKPSIDDMIYENHAIFGHWLKRNFSFKSGGHQVVTDRNGIIVRKPGGNLSAADGARRIMMVGDSLLEGYQVASEHNMSIHVEARLNNGSTQQKYHVLNLGKGGFSPIKYLLVYRFFSKEYRPDIVTTFFYFSNDVQDDARIKDAGRIIFDESGQTLRLIPEVDLSGREVWTPWGGRIHLDVREDRYRWLGSLDFIKWRAVPHLCDVVGDWVNGGREASRAGRFPPQVPIREAPYAIFKDNYSAQDRDDIKLSLSYLKKMNEEVLAAGAIMLLVVIPDKIQVSTAQPGVTKVIDTPRPQDVFTRFAEENDIPYLDLLPKLKEHGDRVMFLSDSHFNIEGHRVVGEIVANAILELEKMQAK